MHVLQEIGGDVGGPDGGAQAEEEMDGEPGLDEDEEDKEGAEVLQTHTAAHTEQFNADLKERLKADVDKFEEMVQHEEQIRLGDEGWKGRYYKVCVC
jgi:5'-3' exoribonuclease 2